MGAGPGFRPRPPRPALRSGPQRLGAALAVEPAPALQRGLRPDPELGHGVGLRHPAVDHGRRRGDPLLECVPGLFPAHGQQRLASERPVYPLPFSHGLAGDGQGLGRRLAADAGVEELDGPPPGLQVVLHPEVYTHGKPPISRCPRNGRQFTAPFMVVQRRISPNYKRRHQAQPTFGDPKSKSNGAFQPPHSGRSLAFEYCRKMVSFILMIAYCLRGAPP